MKITRRQLLVGGSLAIGTAGVVYKASTSVDTEVISRAIDIPVSGLPKEFGDYRIGFLSDIHLGLFLPEDRLVSAVDRLVAAKPDVVVLGGDYISVPRGIVEHSWPILNAQLGSVSRSAMPAAALEMLTKSLARLKPRDGILAILGNHDYWLDPRICAEKLSTKAKAQVLVNQSLTVKRGQNRISFLGVDDFWTGIPELPLSAVFQDGKHIRILLAHNPDYVQLILSQTNSDGDQIGESLFELALCGHTHGGQIRLPGVGAVTYNVSATHLADGLYRQGRTRVFTSRGIGAVEIPVRLNCPPETNIITLKRA